MICGIYKITNNTNNKVYIGQSVNIERRLSEHKRGRGSLVVGREIEKYGLEHFSFEVLEECQKQDLNEKEALYIQIFNSLTPTGYNVADPLLTPYQESSKPLSEAEVEGITLLLRGGKETISKIATKFGIKTWTVYRINLGESYFREIQYPIRDMSFPKKKCLNCSAELTSPQKKYCSEKCFQVAQRRTERPSKEHLKEELINSSFVQVGKKYGVSDSAIRRWCKAYGMPTHAKYYKR